MAPFSFSAANIRNRRLQLIRKPPAAVQPLRMNPALPNLTATSHQRSTSALMQIKESFNQEETLR